MGLLGKLTGIFKKTSPADDDMEAGAAPVAEPEDGDFEASAGDEETVADIATDAAFVLEPSEEELANIAAEDENAEPPDEKGKRKRVKKEKPVKVKKEKPVKVKKEKPVKEKKVKPAKAAPEDGAADGTEDSADKKDAGIKKKLPLLVWVAVILLLIPGNILFFLNFFSNNDNNVDNEPPQIIAPDNNVEDEPDEKPPPDEDEPDIDEPDDEDDPDEDDSDKDQQDDPNGGTGDNDEDDPPPDEINFARLMGRTSSAIKEVLGEPINEETSDSGYIIWSFGTHANISLIMDIFENRVFQMRFLDDEFSLFGIECGIDVLDARAHLMVNLGFVFTGSLDVDDLQHITFRNLYHTATVMVTLVAEEDGTVAEIIYTDVDTAQKAGV